MIMLPGAGNSGYDNDYNGLQEYYTDSSRRCLQDLQTYKNERSYIYFIIEKSIFFYRTFGVFFFV